MRTPFTAFTWSRLRGRTSAGSDAWRWSRSGIPGLLASMLMVSAGRPAGVDSVAHLQDYLGQVTPEEISPGAENFGTPEGNPLAAAAFKGHQPLGDACLDSDVADSTSDPGKPIRIPVGIELDGRIVGAKRVDHDAGDGRYSFKGSGYVRGGISDRFEVVQADRLIRRHDRDYERRGTTHAFVNALRTDFRWERFLMDPLILILWFAIASAMLFRARGRATPATSPCRTIRTAAMPPRMASTSSPRASGRRR